MKIYTLVEEVNQENLGVVKVSTNLKDIKDQIYDSTMEAMRIDNLDELEDITIDKLPMEFWFTVELKSRELPQGVQSYFLIQSFEI